MKYYRWWNPFREVYDLQKAINNLFEDTPFSRDYRAKYPLLDLIDKDDNYIIRAEMPGVCKDTAKITVKGNILTIEGEKKCIDLAEGAVTLRSERGLGSFNRAIELPSDIQGDKVKATFEDGILYIDLPKKEDEKPREITVELGE